MLLQLLYVLPDGNLIDPGIYIAPRDTTTEKTFYITQEDATWQMIRHFADSNPDTNFFFVTPTTDIEI